MIARYAGISIAASLLATQLHAAVLTETFDDGSITDSQTWIGLTNTVANQSTATGTPGTYYGAAALRLQGADSGRLMTTLSTPIAAGSIVTLSFKTLKTGTGNAISVGLLNDSNTGYLFSNELNNSGINRVNILTTSTAGDSVASAGSLTNIVSKGGTGASDVWHSVQVIWNTATGAVSATIDGIDAGTYTGTATMTTDITKVVIMGAYKNSAYIDEISISVPEPASAAVLGLGGIAVLTRRR